MSQPISPKTPGVSESRGSTRVRVTSDDDYISVSTLDGRIVRLRWSELSFVGILTTDSGPLATDLYWLLQGSDRRNSIAVPLGAQGENDLLHAMQRRLKGFDNMAVVEAMSSTDNAGYPVWDASWPHDGTK